MFLLLLLLLLALLFGVGVAAHFFVWILVIGLVVGVLGAFSGGPGRYWW